MSKLFISATGTEVGKTYATLKLIEAFSRVGIRVGVYKPFETGVKTLPLDAKTLLESCKKYNREFKELNLNDITAYTFSLASAPFCAKGDIEIDLNLVLDRANELQKRCDLLLIEGAGGLMVPIEKNLFMIDLAQKLHSFLLLITPSKLGCINETLLSLEALEKRGLNYDWCVNLYKEANSFFDVTKPFYDAYFKKLWFLDKDLDIFVKEFKESNLIK